MRTSRPAMVGLLAVFVVAVIAGCAATVSSVQCEPSPRPDAGARDDATASDASVDAATIADGAADDPCRCAFHWTQGPEIILCYARGDCDAPVRCVPVMPLTEEPSCRFE